MNLIYSLYSLVRSNGGCQEVTSKRLWENIAHKLGIVKVRQCGIDLENFYISRIGLWENEEVRLGRYQGIILIY